LKYKSAIIIPSIFYSEMLLSCIRSIIRSDYEGTIYVISNSESVRSIENIDSKVKFVYNCEIGVSSGDKNIAIAATQLDNDTDIIIYIHNDVIVSPTWYSGLMRSWELVGLDKVSCISMPYIAHDWKRRNTHEYDNDLGLTYEELIEKYKIYEYLFPTHLTEANQLVGTGMDMPNINLPIYPSIYNSSRANREVGGKWSCCTSLSYKDYMRSLERYGCETYYAMEIFMLRDAIYSRKWNLFSNATPVIHTVSYDTTRYGDFGKTIPLAYKSWFDVFHYNLEHLIVIWSDILHNIHRDEIITHVNKLEFDNIDYIFDNAIKLVDELTCDACSAYCHVRNKLHMAWPDYDVYAT